MRSAFSAALHPTRSAAAFLRFACIRVLFTIAVPPSNALAGSCKCSRGGIAVVGPPYDVNYCSHGAALIYIKTQGRELASLLRCQRRPAPSATCRPTMRLGAGRGPLRRDRESSREVSRKSHMMDARSRSRRALLATLACWSALAAGSAQAQACAGEAAPLHRAVPTRWGDRCPDAHDCAQARGRARTAGGRGQPFRGGGNDRRSVDRQSAPRRLHHGLATFGPIAINPEPFREDALRPIRELAPVSLAGNIYNVLVVHPALPAPSVKDLIALARQRPGELNYGSSGPGAADHMAAELFQVMTRTRMVHVPYKGGPLAMVDLISGNLQLMFSTVPTAAGLIKAGKLRPMAIANSTRFPAMPELPTIAEAGVPTSPSTTGAAYSWRAERRRR